MICQADCPSDQPKQEMHQTSAHQYGTIDTEGLKHLLQAKVPLVLLDARTGSYDDGKRIPSAKALALNASAEEAAAQIPNKESLVIVYCTNLKCPAGAMLAERLLQLGYKNVIKYREGIQQWIASGNQVTSIK